MAMVVILKLLIGVLVGRAFLYGTAVGGEAGASAAVAILRDEIDRTMAPLGCRSVKDIRPHLIRKR